MVHSDLRKLIAGWRIQVRVIHALMIREINTRYGRQNIGFLWIMVEPILFAGLVAAIWRLWKGPEEHGISIIAFVVTGYIPITLFRHCVARSAAIFTANSSLMYHQQVKIIDFIFVRFIIELLGSMMAYIFIAGVLISLDLFPIPKDMGLFIAGWINYAIFSLAICFIIAPLSEVSEVIEKLIPVTTYIMIPFSGLFTMLSWMTPSSREYLLWSPFVNAMEMMRKGIWGDDVTAYYYAWNPIAFSLITTLIGLALCRHVRRTLSVE